MNTRLFCSYRSRPLIVLVAVSIATSVMANYPDRDRQRGNRDNGPGGGGQQRGGGDQGKSSKDGNAPGASNSGGNNAGKNLQKFNGNSINNGQNSANQLRQQNLDVKKQQLQQQQQLQRQIEKKQTESLRNNLEQKGTLNRKGNDKIQVDKLRTGASPPTGSIPNGKVDLPKQALGKDPKLIGKDHHPGKGPLGDKKLDTGVPGAPPLGIKVGDGANTLDKQASKDHAKQLFDKLHDHDADHWHGKKFNWGWTDYNTLHYHHHHGYWFGGIWYPPLLIVERPTIVYLPVVQPTPSGRRWLGVTFEPYDGGGVFVTGVYEGSPAQQAGIAPGDVILTLDEYDATDLRAAVQASIDPVDVVVISGQNGEVSQRELILAVP